jgi:GNAT superfamily N-acetyltransferase
MQTSSLKIEPALPHLPGLLFRHFAGERDFASMAAVFNASETADGFESASTADEIANDYTHRRDTVLGRDLLLVEVQGNLIGYGHVFTWKNDAGERIYWHYFLLRPEWRRRRIGTAFLRWAQGRLREMAAAHPTDGPRFFTTYVVKATPGAVRLMESDGYRPVRHFYLMVRPSLDDIPDFPLPAGLEVRPARPEHYRAIWEAQQEAYRDHWGAAQPAEDHYQRWLNNPRQFQPEVWKVAWDVASHQVAGMVLGFIDADENAQFNRRRGWTENIAVRRPWRKRGLARALIAQNLHELKARGMTEAALGVDSDNPTGAFHVYELCGFRPAQGWAAYRKPFA